MAAQLTQIDRRLRLHTPLGDDVLLPTAMHGREALSTLSRFELSCLSKEPDLAAVDILGKAVRWQVVRDDDGVRHFSGHVVRFGLVGPAHGLFEYSVEVAPWLWLLTRVTDCRVFQDKSVPDIVKEICGEFGLGQVDDGGLSASYDPKAYSVQYRESSYAYIARLLEQEGIFYWFRQLPDSTDHKLMLGDGPMAFADAEQGELDYSMAGDLQGKPQIARWRRQFAYTSGKATLTDYDFDEQPARANRTPAELLKAVANAPLGLDGADAYDLFDYPGGFADAGAADNCSKLRIQEETARHDVCTAHTNCAALAVGETFAIRKHVVEAEEGAKYAVLAVDHVAEEPAAYASGASHTGGECHYRNDLQLIPADADWRPPRVTPRPQIHGVQTAVVVGPDGEEIHTDEYGRIRVQFFWDRHGKRDDDSSIFVRHMQAQAGLKWGTYGIPRIGQEVVVTFEEGDPDRPLVIGSLHNGEQLPPYELPEHKTRSGYRTNSTLGGEGHNEVRFEDKKDQEQIYVHAEKDMHLRVRHDVRERIHNDHVEIIGGATEDDDGQGEEPTGDYQTRVYRDRLVNVKRHRREHVEGDYRIEVGGGAGNPGHFDLTAGKAVRMEVGSEGIHGKTDGPISAEAARGYSLAAMSVDEKAETEHKTEAGMAMHLKAGMSLNLEAGMTINIKAGPSFISLTPAGVFISGPTVMINSGGSASPATAAQPAAPKAPELPELEDPPHPDNTETGSKSTPF